MRATSPASGCLVHRRHRRLAPRPDQAPVHRTRESGRVLPFGRASPRGSGARGCSGLSLSPSSVSGLWASSSPASRRSTRPGHLPRASRPAPPLVFAHSQAENVAWRRHPEGRSGGPSRLWTWDSLSGNKSGKERLRRRPAYESNRGNQVRWDGECPTVGELDREVIVGDGDVGCGRHPGVESSHRASRSTSFFGSTTTWRIFLRCQV